VMFVCCICDVSGEHRAGSIREGHRVPMCAECFATIYWRSRQPAPARVVSLYEMQAGRAALASAGH
jgi:hypothetical protein